MFLKILGIMPVCSRNKTVEINRDIQPKKVTTFLYIPQSPTYFALSWLQQNKTQHGKFLTRTWACHAYVCTYVRTYVRMYICVNIYIKCNKNYKIKNPWIYTFIDVRMLVVLSCILSLLNRSKFLTNSIKFINL